MLQELLMVHDFSHLIVSRPDHGVPRSSKHSKTAPEPSSSPPLLGQAILTATAGHISPTPRSKLPRSLNIIGLVTPGIGDIAAQLDTKKVFPYVR